MSYNYNNIPPNGNQNTNQRRTGQQNKIPNQAAYGQQAQNFTQQPAQPVEQQQNVESRVDRLEQQIGQLNLILSAVIPRLVPQQDLALPPEAAAQIEAIDQQMGALAQQRNSLLQANPSAAGILAPQTQQARSGDEELTTLDILERLEGHARYTTLNPRYQFNWPTPNLLMAFAMYRSTAIRWRQIKALVIDAVTAHKAHLQRQQNLVLMNGHFERLPFAFLFRHAAFTDAWHLHY